MGWVIQGFAVAGREQVGHRQCGGAGLHDGGPGHDAGVVTALNGQLGVLFGEVIHGVLLLVDAGSGLDHRAEHHGHAVGDAAVDAGIVVAGGDHGPLRRHAEGVVGLGAPQPGKAEPVPNSMP